MKYPSWKDFESKYPDYQEIAFLFGRGKTDNSEYARDNNCRGKVQHGYETEQREHKYGHRHESVEIIDPVGHPVYQVRGKQDDADLGQLRRLEITELRDLYPSRRSARLISVYEYIYLQAQAQQIKYPYRPDAEQPSDRIDINMVIDHRNDQHEHQSDDQEKSLSLKVQIRVVIISRGVVGADAVDHHKPENTEQDNEHDKDDIVIASDDLYVLFRFLKHPIHLGTHSTAVHYILCIYIHSSTLYAY